MHPRTATAHAVAIVISCPVTVSKQSKRKVTSKNGVKKGEELGLMSGYEWSVLYWLHQRLRYDRSSSSSSSRNNSRLVIQVRSRFVATEESKKG